MLHKSALRALPDVSSLLTTDWESGLKKSTDGRTRSRLQLTQRCRSSDFVKSKILCKFSSLLVTRRSCRRSKVTSSAHTLFPSPSRLYLHLHYTQLASFIKAPSSRKTFIPFLLMPLSMHALSFLPRLPMQFLFPLPMQALSLPSPPPIPPPTRVLFLESHVPTRTPFLPPI